MKKKNENMHCSSGYPPNFPLLLLKKMDLGEKILQNPKRREWKKWNNGEREK
jgi:hypothetical protein